jgi:endonuclease V-like protein UPF0215 family
MARQRLSEKNVAKLRKETGLPVIAVLVRGGTAHRKDLCLEDGSVVRLYADGTTELSSIRHNMKRPNAQVQRRR